MRIYYDINSNRVVLGDTLNGLANSALIAVDFDTRNDKIGIMYRNSTIYEIVAVYQDICGKDSLSVGETKEEVLNYLNAEFAKNIEQTGGGGNVTIVNPTIQVYDRPLSGTTVVIPNTEHQINEICSIFVRNSDGARVDVVDSVLNNTITLTSNVDLTDYTLRVTGFSTIKKYVKQLSGLSNTTSKAEHGIDNIFAYEVRNNLGKAVDIEDLLNTTNNTITIKSNVNLNNCTLTIKGL
jgi:hypothetical protein